MIPNQIHLFELVYKKIMHHGEFLFAIYNVKSSSFQFIDSNKVNNWYKDVKALLDRETELANMHWIELSIPIRGGTRM